MAELSIQNLSKEFPGGVQAVRDLSIDVVDGEFLVLVGPSGCGKTTTLRMIAGLDEPTAGDLFIDGRRVNDVPPKDRDIAMVFQNYALYPHMTVYKNMAFGLTLRKYPKAEIRERVAAAAKVLGLEELLDRKPKALSGGQRQRVAVGRAIVRDPKIFLFDEPLSNLDAALRVQMRGELSQLHKRLGSTMVYVTHDQVEAMTLGHRIAVMNDGILNQIGTPNAVYREPVNAFVAGFIGSPPMNLVPAEIATTNGNLSLKLEGGAELHVDERHTALLDVHGKPRVHLGIRPEDIRLNRAQIPADGVSFETALEVVEPLGAETLAHFELGSIPCVARLDGDAAVGAGETYVLDVRMANAHYFDAGSGLRLV